MRSDFILRSLIFLTDAWLSAAQAAAALAEALVQRTFATSELSSTAASASALDSRWTRSPHRDVIGVQTPLGEQLLHVTIRK